VKNSDVCHGCRQFLLQQHIEEMPPNNYLSLPWLSSASSASSAVSAWSGIQALASSERIEAMVAL
jgi:hypothetical protein